MSSGSSCDRFFPENLNHLIFSRGEKMHELCRFAFSKSAKFESSPSKPEKPNGRNSMHELCRFADLFPIGPTQITRFFHWTEHYSEELINEQTQKLNNKYNPALVPDSTRGGNRTWHWQDESL
jgi:hypothetical protein